MRTAGYSRAPFSVLVAFGAVFLTSCATATHPQQFRTFFLPPSQPSTAADDSPIEPPVLTPDQYSNEVPFVATSLPRLPRPSDTDLVLKTADDLFARGKKAYQEGRLDEARRQFNAAVAAVLMAPDNLPDRARLERHLEELVENIYRYDVDQAAASDSEDQVSYDKSPLDGILEMTFPVDPGLRNKVREQVEATVSQIPLEESDAVVGAINFFSTERGKKILSAGLRRSGRYKPLIERILAEEGLPQELIFVAQAESGFLPRAISNKLCVGLWQFAKFRGREYGLEQTSATDDRMDPEKATRAAARHLHDLYTHFGDWYLALAAYDCGPGCVDRAVARTGYADYWTLRRLNVLPKETGNYVPVILAMTIMAKNSKDYGIDNLDLDPPLEFDTLELQTPTHLMLVADAAGRSLSELRELNPGLLRPIAPSGYTLRLPKGTAEAVEAAFAIVPPNRRDSWRLHRVETGDTLATVAKRYGTTAVVVGSANHDGVPDAGALMVVPVPYPGARAARPGASRRRSSVTASAHVPPGNKPVVGKTTVAHKTVAHKETPKSPVHRAAAAGAPAS